MAHELNARRYEALEAHAAAEANATADVAATRKIVLPVRARLCRAREDDRFGVSYTWWAHLPTSAARKLCCIKPRAAASICAEHTVGVESDQVVNVGADDKQALLGVFEEDARFAVALLEPYSFR